MSRSIRTSALALAVASGWALPAHAGDDTAAAAGHANQTGPQQALAALRAQVQLIAQRIDLLEGQLGGARPPAANTSST